MKVSVVALSAPLVHGLKTAEDLIVYIARVSNPNNQLNLDTGAKLLNYCIRHEHWSVFEQVSMTVEIQTSRMISAQILRHHSFKFQEFSQRYATVTEVEPIELRKQAITNRQSSTDIITDEETIELANRSVNNSLEAYHQLLQRGAAKECARAVLPMVTRTTMYMTGSLRSWIHYCLLRTKKHTQKEHRLIADAAKEIIAEHFPIVSEAIVLAAEKKKERLKRLISQRDRLLSIATDMWIHGRNRSNKSSKQWREAQEAFEAIEAEISEPDEYTEE